MSSPLSPFQQLGKLLAPPPPVLHPEYDGLEYRWKIFTFRPALFSVEPYILLGLAFYLLAFFIGKTRNSTRANAWFDAHLPLLSQQFSKPTVAGLVPDGYSDFFNFSTGRRNIASLHVVLKLVPRHDLLQRAYQFVWSCVDLTYNPKDELELDFKLFTGPNSPTYVWAAVNKDYLPKIKETRWDLTFTRATENAQLGPGFVVLSEFADITENILQKSSTHFGLAELINNPAYKRYIRSISITDQPRERPTKPISDKRERHVIVSLTIPPTSQASVTVPLVEGIFKLIDNLDSKVTLRPETKSKLKKAREELDEEIRKEATAEQREEAENDKAAAKRKAMEEKLSKLSAAEQKKAMERERKRAIRKSQGKVVRK